MAWFRCESSFRDHRKIKQLARRLDITRRDCRGLVIGLFCSVCRESPDGSLEGWHSEDIADAADWDGDPGELLKALQDVRLVVSGDDQQLHVNDWMEYAEGYKTALRVRKHRVLAREKEAKKCNVTVTDPGNVTVTDPGNVTVTDPGNVTVTRTRPDQTRPTRPTRPDRPDRPGNVTVTDPGNVTVTDPGNVTVPLQDGGSLGGVGDWPVQPIYARSLEEWGINRGYGIMPPAKQVEVQQLKALSLDEVRYAHDQTQRKGGKLNWGYFLACVITARTARPRSVNQAPTDSIGREYGQGECADFSALPQGASWGEDVWKTGVRDGDTDGRLDGAGGSDDGIDSSEPGSGESKAIRSGGDTGEESGHV